MKLHLLILILLTITCGLAQQPGTGFGRKVKTTQTSPGLARRLNADLRPILANRAGRQALTALLAKNQAMTSLRFRVVNDSTTGLPVFIERKLTNQTSISASKNSGAPLSAEAAASVTFQFMGQVRGLLKLENPASNFTVTRTETDDLGQQHVRLTQTHRGVPVLGAELVAHLADGEVTLLNGRYQSIPNELEITPQLTLADASARALADVRKTSTVRSFGDNILKMKSTEGELCVFAENGLTKLAYQLTVRPNMLERWEYVIYAKTGDVLDKYNHTCTVVGPIKASGKDLNGVTRSIQTYQQSNNAYYLIDATRPMFNATTSKMPGDPVGALWTVDARNIKGDNPTLYQVTSTNNTDWTATAISAHYNAGVAYDYYRNTFNRNALNGNGATIVSLINIVDDDGKGLDNAYWNGQIMAYGNGRLLKPLAGALDVAGHEMTHGVIQNTANLQYKSQSGAINESSHLLMCLAP